MADNEHRLRLFRDRGYQTLRIPREFEFEGEEVVLRKVGNRLIIEPVRHGQLIAQLATLRPLDERLTDVNENLPPPMTANCNMPINHFQPSAERGMNRAGVGQARRRFGS